MAAPSRVDSLGLCYLEAWSAASRWWRRAPGRSASWCSHDRDGLLVGARRRRRARGGAASAPRRAAASAKRWAGGDATRSWRSTPGTASSIACERSTPRSAPGAARDARHSRWWSRAITPPTSTRCLDSLRASTLPPAEIVVLDHASTRRHRGPGAQERTRASSSSSTATTPGSARASIAGGGSRAATCCCCSTRTRRWRLDCIERLAAALESPADVAAVGPKVLVAGDRRASAAPGSASTASATPAIAATSSSTRDSTTRPRRCSRASGCALMVRARACDRGRRFRSPPTSSTTRTSTCAGACGSPDTGSSTSPPPCAYHRPGADATGVFRHYHDHRNRLRTLIKNCGASTLARLSLPVAWFELSSLAALALARPIARLRLATARRSRRDRATALGVRWRGAGSSGSRRAPEDRLFAFLVPSMAIRRRQRRSVRAIEARTAFRYPCRAESARAKDQ